jgi:hypothetical protein
MNGEILSSEKPVKHWHIEAESSPKIIEHFSSIISNKKTTFY